MRWTACWSWTEAAWSASTDPGVALGRSVAGTVGLPAPSLVRLAEAAGIAPGLAFDESAVADGLRSAGREPGRANLASGGAAAAIAEAAADATAWRPDAGREPTTIEVDRLVHRYPGGVEAVRGVSLTIPSGQAVAILGQNGSGKTTLVKHLNGLLRPASGDVRIDGRSRVDDRVDQLAATVGFAFQNPDDQLFERTVEREVAFGPRNLGMPAERVAALVERSIAAVGLTDDRATNPYDLDLSRRKLVALASVLAMDPAVLVLDEPTTGQDPEGIARVASVVAAWRAAGRTAIAITHDMEFAAATFERIVVMRRGEIIADGPPTDVLTAANADLLASTGLTPPPTARIADALGPHAAAVRGRGAPERIGRPRVAHRPRLNQDMRGCQRRPTTINRNDVSMTSMPAMTAATSSGSGCPIAQPAAAAKAATARNARRTARMSAGTSRSPASASRPTDRPSSTTRAPRIRRRGSPAGAAAA